MRIYYEVPNKNKTSRDNLYRLRQVGSVKEYTLRFNSLILQIDSMSEDEQRFMYARGLKPNVKMEIEKEWVRDPDLDLTRMKQLAYRTDTLFFNNRGGRTVESHLGAPSDQSRPTPMTLRSMKTIFDRFKIPEEKRQEVIDKKLCFKCLKPDHSARFCRAPKNE
jgi:Retrotransposon gag protein